MDGREGGKDKIVNQTEKLITEAQQRFRDAYINPLEAAVGVCESPIETLLLWQLINEVNGWNSVGFSGAVEVPSHWLAGGSWDRSSWCIGLGDVSFHPQLEVEANERLYRLDIGMDFSYRRNGELVYSVLLDIECDGFDYHDRTKEQAARDRSRDQSLQAIGWYICRFTGSEIFRDAPGCAHRVFRMADEIMRRLTTRK